MKTSKWSKPLRFALYAALGCLCSAVLGDGWLALTKPAEPPAPPPPPASPPKSVVLVLDTSFSMFMPSSFVSTKLGEMKDAARGYVGRQDMGHTRIAVVRFDNDASVALPLSNDAAAITQAIDGLQVGGMTRIDLGLTTALQQLSATGATQKDEELNILLFTDGVPGSDQPGVDAYGLTLQAAQEIRDAKVRLLAIATGDADRTFLTQVTGDQALVFWADAGQFGEAFKQAERAMAPAGQLVESSTSGGGSAGLLLLRQGIWTGLLALGAAFALLLAQKRYSHQTFARRDAVIGAAALGIGITAGLLGQGLFLLSTGGAAVVFLGRVIGWIVLGGLLGAGMAFFIPNLQKDRATQGGAFGGLVGALFFVIASFLLGDIVGRWVGAALIGFFIGLMVVLAEVAFRKAWLHVRYSASDAFDVNLGREAITVGSDRERVRVIASQAPPLAATYGLEGGRIYFRDATSGVNTNVTVGDQRTFGNVVITVCGEVAEVAAAPGVQVTPQGIMAPLPNRSGPQAPSPPPGPAPVSSHPPVQVPLPHYPAPHYPAAPAGPAPWSPVPQPAAPIGTPPNSPAFTPGASVGWVLSRQNGDLRVPPTGAMNLGRATDNQMVLTDPGVSSHHARLEASLAGLTVTDLGSTNGTFLNGARLAPNAPALLQPNDRVMFGRLEFIVLRG